MKKYLVAVFVLFVFVGVGLAQQPVPIPTTNGGPTVTQAKQKAADFAQPDAKASAVPVLTEVEKLKLELLQVRTAYAQLLAQHDGCKAELGATYNALGKLRADAAGEELTAEEAKLKTAIEQTHPGYTWDPKTGVFTPIPKK